jgi:superoxide reductase
MKLKVFKCNKCGTVLLSFDDSEVLECCGNEMVEQVPNSVDASFEKHLPTYTIMDNKIIAEVHHVMEDEHYIEWIACVSKNREHVKYLEPGDVAEVTFKYKPDSIIYAYCNKHGLWKNEVK